MSSEELTVLIQNSAAVDESIRQFALSECVPGGTCFEDPDFLPVSHWYAVWAARARRMSGSAEIDGLESTLAALGSLDGEARCVNLKRAGRTVLVWFSQEGSLLACLAY